MDVEEVKGLTECPDIAPDRLQAPPLRQGIVDRPALLDSLTATGAPLVLVSAPAGYGKTTLLALWARRGERRFAWLSLDRSHNDSVVLSAALVAAMGSVVPVDPGVQLLLGTSDPAAERHVVSAVTRAWSLAREPVALVLDDVHLLTDERCLEIVADLVEHIPGHGQLALATRRDPALALGSLRAHGRLSEVRAGDLALGPVEARALFDGAGLALSDASVGRLVRRTEGWAAGLYLAALSLRDREQPERFVEQFAGTTRHVADFLSEDVLARQPRTVTRFLQHTCVAEELNGSLCRALTEDPHAEVALRELERSNLFVVPMDDERRTYRYHPLFAEYLRADVARHQPQLLPVLHRRAWRWYQRHGVVTRAVMHAQAAGDIDVATELVAADWLPLLEHGRVETVRTLLAGFTPSQIRDHASLTAATRWIAALTGQSASPGEPALLDEPAEPAEAAEAAAPAPPAGPAGTPAPPTPEHALAAMSGAVNLKGVSSIRMAARHAVDLAADPTWRPLSLAILGAASKLEGDFSSARRWLTEAVRLTDGRTATGILALGYLALISLREGDDDQALAYARAAHPALEQPGIQALAPCAVIFTAEANALARRGDLTAAAQAVEHAETLLTALSDTPWWQAVDTRIWLVPALAAQGRRAEAHRRLAEAEVVLGRHPDAGKLNDWVGEAARTLANHLPAAPAGPRSCGDLTRAERRILGLLAGELTLREIGRELCLSRNTIKTHTHAIYRKLGVSSRAEAVAVSRSHRAPVGGTRPKGAPGAATRTAV